MKNFVIIKMEVCMKKNSLLKAIGIVVILFMLLTWIIPTSEFVVQEVVNDETVKNQFINNGHMQMGLFDLAYLPFRFFSDSNVSMVAQIDGMTANFVSYVAIVLGLLSIGIFYKVLNKTGAYGKLVENIVNKLKDKKVLFIIISILMFTIFSSLTGLTLLLFLLVPFFTTILLKLKFSKVTTFASTVLPILVGRICSITAWDITGVNRIVYGVSWNDNLLIRIITLIIFMVLTIIYVVMSKSPADENVEDPMYEKNVKNEKSYVPLLALTGLFFFIMAAFMYNWFYTFTNASVTEAYETIMSNTINNYPFVNNLLGALEPFGYWNGFTMSVMLLLLSLILSFIYSLSFDDIVSSIRDGIKGMGKVVIYVVLASMVMTFVCSSAYSVGESSNIFYTIAHWINGNISFEPIPFSTLTSGVYSIFLHDYSTIALQSSDFLNSYFTGGDYSLAVLCFQTIHGLIALVTPTSIFLVAGLVYLDIPYKKWLSYIWKLLLCLVLLGLLILFIVSVI